MTTNTWSAESPDSALQLRAIVPSPGNRASYLTDGS
jgi:hypothetical protein